MRVVETDTTPSYKMGKNRKHRLRKKNEAGGSDSSEEGAVGGVGCTHITKAVNLAAVRKAVSKPSVTFGECGTCGRDKGGSSKGVVAPAVTDEAGADFADRETETTIWVCLQCGHQGCDRNSKDKHALGHFEAPHSGIHCIVVNLTSWTSWCYTCDDLIPLESSKRVQECVDMLRKMAGLPRMDYAVTATGRRVRSEPATDYVVEKDKGRPTTPRPGGAASASCQKVKGLSNLGNTCFFNAVMQNLSQTHSLEMILVERTKKGRSLALPGHTTHSDSDSGASSEEDSEDEMLKELPSVECVTPDAGPLTQVLLSFVQEMNNTSSRSMIVNPASLFGQICKKAPRFKGFQQQDSHELLRYLLDVIRTEEIKRGQSGILKHFKLPESTNPKKVDDETKLKIKEYGRQVKHTFLDSLFGGQLVSTVMCEECKHVSQTFEPFLDLSLPVTEEKPLRPNLMLGGRKKEGCETEEVRGVEKSSELPAEKPSKYSEKKNRKQAKREAKAKRRAEKVARQKSWMSADDAGKDEEVGAVGEDTKMAVSLGEKVAEDEGEESLGSAREEDQSDADVEDNLESDTSRLITSVKDDALYEKSAGEKPEPVKEEPEAVFVTPVESDVTSNNLGETNSEADCTISKDPLVGDVVVTNGNPITPERCDAQTQDRSAVNGDISGVSDLCTGLNRLKVAEEPQLCNGEEKSGDRTMNGEWGSCGVGACCAEGAQHCEDCQQKAAGIETRIYGDVSCNGPVTSFEDDVKVNGFSESPVTCQQEMDVDSKAEVESQLNLTAQFDSEGTLKGESEVTLQGVSSHLLTPLITSPDDVVANDLQGRYSPNQAKNKAELRRQAQYKSMNTLSPRYQPSAKECSILSCLHQFTSAELLTGSNKFGCKQCTKNKRNKMCQQKEKKAGDTVYSSASKQYHVFVPPAVLTLHLKRFEQVGFSSRKVNRHVDFPFVLDLASYCSSLCQGVRPGQKKILYALYGVVEHSGRLSGGHYTAYVKVRPSLATLTNYLNTQVPAPRDYIHNYTNCQLNGPRSPAGEDPADDAVESLMPPGKWYHISDSRVSEVQESSVQRAQAYLLFYERIY